MATYDQRDIKLNYLYHFWFSFTQTQNLSKADNEYLLKIRELASFESIKGFWRIY
jgi:hypothetical protein